MSKIELTSPFITDNGYANMIIALAKENLGDKLDESKIEKIIIIPNKVINFVLKKEEPNMPFTCSCGNVVIYLDDLYTVKGEPVCENCYDGYYFNMEH